MANKLTFEEWWVNDNTYYTETSAARAGWHARDAEIAALTAERDAAYERGLRDAFDSIKDTFTENARPVILKVILALKDRGAKGEGE